MPGRARPDAAGTLHQVIVRGVISKVRSPLAWKLADKLGAPSAEIARQLGVSTSAISQILGRKQIA
jgi:predicted transcriptional regulator